MSLLAAEDKATGSVPWAVYGRYVRCLGLVLACVVVLGLLAGEAAYLAADWWLALWAAEEPEQQAEPRCAGRHGVCIGNSGSEPAKVCLRRQQLPVPTQFSHSQYRALRPSEGGYARW